MRTSNNPAFNGDIRASAPEYEQMELMRTLQRMSFGEFGQETMRESHHSIEPEIKLIYAVLGEAVETLTTAQGSNWREVERVIKWLRSRHGGWIFGFVTVCEAIGLDPSAVRSALERRYPYAWALKEAARLVRQGKLGFADIRDRTGAKPADIATIAKGILMPSVALAKIRALRLQDDPTEQGSWLIDPVEPVSLLQAENPDPNDSADLTLDH